MSRLKTELDFFAKEFKSEFKDKLKKLSKFDWSSLIPAFRMDKYSGEPSAYGIEFTLRYTGPGIGVGLGHRDFWFGWPPRAAE